MVSCALQVGFGVFLISSFFSLLYLYQRELRYQKITHEHELPLATESITPLNNLTFILAPYYEPRVGPSVRVLSILHVSVKELFCDFHCEDDRVISVKAKTEMHGDRFGFPYGTTDLVCAEPVGCDYTHMSFHGSNSSNVNDNIRFKVKNRPLPEFSSNFSICMSTLYGGYNNALQIVQNLEMYKILGASRVTMYITNVTQNVEKVLRHYIDEGILEMVSWPIDRHFKVTKKWRFTPGERGQIGYYGQTAALNDCLYRSMYKSRFVFLNDIDELILPVKDRDYPSLMERLQKLDPEITVFRIENRIFTILFNDSKFDLWPHVPGVNILSHPFKEPNHWIANNLRKMIVNPRHVFQTSIHAPLRNTGKISNIEQNLALIFHCKFRVPVTRDQVIEDEILRQYNSTLVPNVDKVIRILFPWQ
ncbi:beta-1,4-galactosyltransferase galt-1-like [Gastrophryne carolinensis]